MKQIQKEIRERLTELYRKGKVPHAMLFAGPRGAGKLYMAIEFAKLLLCENSKDLEPCGECPSCKMTSNLFHPDLLFVFPTIKKDSNDKRLSQDHLQTFVEFYNQRPFFSLDDWTNYAFEDGKMPNIYNAEAVSLLERVENKPARGKRVVIFLCPELMNAECANRLLKTIEEPEGANIFIFVSDHPNDILETIISRLQRIYFPPLTESDIKRLIPEASDNVASICHGDMCSAMHLMEGSEELTRNHEAFIQLMRWSFQKDVDSMLKWCNDDVSKLSRKEQIGMLESFIDIIREIQMLKLGASEVSYLSDDLKVFVSKFMPFLFEERVPQFVEIFSDAIVSIGRNCQSKLVLFDMCLKTLVLIPRKLG